MDSKVCITEVKTIIRPGCLYSGTTFLFQQGNIVCPTLIRIQFLFFFSAQTIFNTLPIEVEIKTCQILQTFLYIQIFLDIHLHT